MTKYRITPPFTINQKVCFIDDSMPLDDSLPLDYTFHAYPLVKGKIYCVHGVTNSGKGIYILNNGYLYGPLKNERFVPVEDYCDHSEQESVDTDLLTKVIEEMFEQESNQ